MLHETEGEMNFDDIVRLPLYFFVFAFFTRFPSSCSLSSFFRLFQCLYWLLFIFKKYISCKFLAYIFAISAYEASNVCMSVQVCYKTIFACSFFCFGWSESNKKFDNNKNFVREEEDKRLYLRAERL